MLVWETILSAKAVHSVHFAGRFLLGCVRRANKKRRSSIVGTLRESALIDDYLTAERVWRSMSFIYLLICFSSLDWGNYQLRVRYSIGMDISK